MGYTTCCLFLVLSSCLTLVSGHIALWHESMWGFNVTSQMFPYDNRPVAPLQQYTFDQWWFHNHLAYPPPANTFMSLPAGGKVTTELACTKSATTLFASSGGGDIQAGNNPCPGSPPTEFHTQGPDDLKGCALAITHQSDVTKVKPADFAVFSVNHTCVWNRFTDFAVPEKMPACPEGGCICAWFWIHSADAGSEQNYMNGFRCNVTGATSTVPIATSRVPRRCGADPDFKKPDAAPWNCTYGAKQPFYWLQKEQNNMFEGEHAPPYYLDLYGFADGAQADIFADSPLPVFDAQGVQTGFATRGGDAATTVAVVTPTGTSWPTTLATSAPAAAAATTATATTSSVGAGGVSSSAAAPSVSSSSSSAPSSSSSSVAPQPTLASGSGSGSSKQCHLRQSAFSTQGHSKRRRRHNHNKKRELWR